VPEDVQGCAERGNEGGVGSLLCDVGELVRIDLEIVELAIAILILVVEIPGCPDTTGRGGGDATPQMFDQQRAAPCRIRILQQREQVHAVDR
jgi:hypothetical protein